MSAGYTDGTGEAVGALPGYQGERIAGSLIGRPDWISGTVAKSYSCTTGAELITPFTAKRERASLYQGFQAITGR